jgi:AcrR family transcriptional regulator
MNSSCRQGNADVDRIQQVMKKVADKPRGARAGRPDTKGAILDAARARFRTHGYEGTSMRAVAGDADVDVALVSYHFGSKQGLFAAAMELPVNPAVMVEALLSQGTADLGTRLARNFIALWDNPESGAALLGMFRSAATHEEAAAMVRGFIEREVLGRLATAIGLDRPDLRAALAGSQLIGMALARYVVKVEPLASAAPEDIVAAIGPTLDRYFTGEIAAAQPPG